MIVGREQSRGHARDIDLVGFEFACVVAELRRKREQRDGDDGAEFVEHPTREPPEEHQGHDAGDERQQPQRQVALRQMNEQIFRGDEKAVRRHLLVAERARQVAERSRTNVRGEHRLVQPKRSAAGEGRDADEKPQRKHHEGGNADRPMAGVLER